MQLLTQGYGTLQAWQGRFVSEAGEPVAQAEFAQGKASSTLRITRGETCMEMVSTTPTFHTAPNAFGGGGGKFTFNGEQRYSFLCATPAEIEVTSASRRSMGKRVLRAQLDSWKRRFLWAYRQGLSAAEARRYAGHGDLLIGSSYALASFHCMRSGHGELDHAGAHTLFHAADEELWATLPEEEQLLVLALSVRHLCGNYHDKRHTLGLRQLPACPNVPSFVPREAPLHASIDPGHFPRRAGESWHTGSPLAKFCLVAAWAATLIDRSPNMVGLAIFVSIPCVLWLLICYGVNRYTLKEW